MTAMIRRDTTHGLGTTAHLEDSRKIPGYNVAHNCYLADNQLGGQYAAATLLQPASIVGKARFRWSVHKQILQLSCHLSILGRTTDLPQKACSVVAGSWIPVPSGTRQRVGNPRTRPAQAHASSLRFGVLVVTFSGSLSCREMLHYL